MPSFTVLHEKPASAQALVLCPTMDLLAYCTAEGAVHVVRWVTWQRVMTLHLPKDAGPVTRMVWSPDGATVAITTARSTTFLLPIDQERLYAITPPVLTPPPVVPPPPSVAPRDTDAPETSLVLDDGALGALPQCFPLVWTYAVTQTPYQLISRGDASDAAGGGHEGDDTCEPRLIAHPPLHSSTLYPQTPLPYVAMRSRAIPTCGSPFLRRLASMAAAAIVPDVLPPSSTHIDSVFSPPIGAVGRDRVTVGQLRERIGFLLATGAFDALLSRDAAKRLRRARRGQRLHRSASSSFTPPASTRSAAAIDVGTAGTGEDALDGIVFGSAASVVGDGAAAPGAGGIADAVAAPLVLLRAALQMQHAISLAQEAAGGGTATGGSSSAAGGSGASSSAGGPAPLGSVISSFSTWDAENQQVAVAAAAAAALQGMDDGGQAAGASSGSAGGGDAGGGGGSGSSALPAGLYLQGYCDEPAYLLAHSTKGAPVAPAPALAPMGSAAPTTVLVRGHYALSGGVYKPYVQKLVAGVVPVNAVFLNLKSTFGTGAAVPYDTAASASRAALPGGAGDDEKVDDDDAADETALLARIDALARGGTAGGAASGVPAPPPDHDRCDGAVVALSASPALHSSLITTVKLMRWPEGLAAQLREAIADLSRCPRGAVSAGATGMGAALSRLLGRRVYVDPATGSVLGAVPFATVRVIGENSEPIAAALPRLHDLTTALCIADSCYKHIARAVRYMHSEWTTALAPMTTLLRGLESALLEETPRIQLEHAKAFYPCSPVPLATAELYRLLTVGVPTATLATWVETRAHDAALARIQRSIETACSALEALAVTHVARAGEILMIVLGELCSEAVAATWTDSHPHVAALAEASAGAQPSVVKHYMYTRAGREWSFLGVTPHQLDCMCREATHLLSLVQAVRTAIVHARSAYVAVIVWLRLLAKHWEHVRADAAAVEAATAAGADGAPAGDAAAAAAAAARARLHSGSAPMPVAQDMALVRAALAPLESPTVAEVHAPDAATVTHASGTVAPPVPVASAALRPPRAGDIVEASSAAGASAGAASRGPLSPDPLGLRLGGAADASGDDPLGLGLGGGGWLAGSPAATSAASPAGRGAASATASGAGGGGALVARLPLGWEHVVDKPASDPFLTYSMNDAIGAFTGADWRIMMSPVASYADFHSGRETAALDALLDSEPSLQHSLADQLSHAHDRMRCVLVRLKRRLQPPLTSYGAPPLQIDVPVYPGQLPEDAAAAMHAIAGAASAWYDDATAAWLPPQPPPEQRSVLLKRGAPAPGADAGAAATSAPATGTTSSGDVWDHYDPAVWMPGSHVLALPLPAHIAAQASNGAVSTACILLLRVASYTIEPGASRMWWKRIAGAFITLPEGCNATATAFYGATAGGLEAAALQAEAAGIGLAVQPTHVGIERNALVAVLHQAAGVPTGTGSDSGDEGEAAPPLSPAGTHLARVSYRDVPMALLPPTPPESRPQPGTSHLHFLPIVPLASVATGIRCVDATTGGSAAAAAAPIGLPGSSAALQALHKLVAGTTLAACGTRGAVAVAFGGTRVVVVDMEEDEEDEAAEGGGVEAVDGVEVMAAGAGEEEGEEEA